MVTNSGRTNLLSSPLLSSFIRLHPDLTRPPTGVDLDLTATGHDPGMLTALENWSIVFTNISLIVNQSTPLHRDPHSRADWYDMLVSVSNYDDCALHIPILGIQVLYNPGTVVAFSSQLFRHGINEVDGARCCLLYFTIG